MNKKLAGFSDKIVDSAIAMYIVASVAIGAVVLLFTTALTSVPASVAGLVPLIGVLFVLGIALGFYYEFRNRGQ